MMNKKGFTLSELLVALGIVGVIGAITIPSIHKILPDKDKGIVLKTYKTLNTINNDIFGNPGLYMFSDNCPSFILQCTGVPADGTHSTVQPLNKYPVLLAENLTLAESNPTFTNGKGSFNTSDGITWAIDVRKDNNNLPLMYEIEIDTHNPNRMANCSYSSTCRNPRRFKFAVDKYGTTRAWDPLTEAYLMNPSDLSDRYADLQSAARSSTDFFTTPD